MKPLHRPFYILRSQSAGQEIGPLGLPEQVPVEDRPRTRTGVQQDVVSHAVFSPPNILLGCNAEGLNDRLSGACPQLPDIVRIFTAVELCQVDDAAVQQFFYSVYSLVYKDPHCPDLR